MCLKQVHFYISAPDNGEYKFDRYDGRFNWKTPGAQKDKEHSDK